MNEQWIKWTPNGVIEDEYEIIQMVQNSSGTTISLDGNNNRLEVVFEGYIHALRTYDEAVCYRTFETIQEENGRGFFTGWPLYVIRNSEFAQWLEYGSYNFYTKKKIIHFCIMGVNDVVDILSTYEPDVKIINK